MIAVIFEVQPAGPAERESYLAMASALRAELEQVDGFVSIERFESLSRPGRMLSLSIFEDEAAVARWRNAAEHRTAQSAGRAGLFSAYRLRVAQIVRDYGPLERAQAPDDSRRAHSARTEAGPRGR
jgi:heme-degrading monooxygenase HmoA